MVPIQFEDALKAKQLRDYFYKHKRIYILVDATADDVVLPAHLKDEHALPLVLNARMPEPIHIRDGFLESNFSFSGVKHHCVIPMGRIWAAYLPERDLSSGIVWENAMPEVVKLVMQGAEALKEKQQAKASPESERQAPQPKEKKGKKFGHLRVIK